MSRILITGGTGTLGSELRPRLIAAGHTVRIMSRRASRPSEAQGVEWAQADIATGQGLSEAVKGVDVIIHAASAGLGDSYFTDVLGTRRLLEAARAANISHFVYVSIVGIDRINFKYYKHKLEAEQLVAESGAPYSILRAPQFHDLVDKILHRLVGSRIGIVDPNLKLQSMDEGEVADHLAEIVAAGPSGRVPDIAGPEVRLMRDLAHAWLEARGLKRLIIPLPFPGGLWAGFRKGLNTVPSNPQGKITFEQWLAKKYGTARNNVAVQRKEQTA